MSEIWFCQCDTIEPGGFCAKHGVPPEEDRLRRRASAEAFKRLTDYAKKIGSWAEVEKKLKDYNA